MSGGTALTYRRLRTPREHGRALIDPPLAEAERLLQQNVRTAEARDYDCQGRPLAELAFEARREMLVAARRYTSAYRDVDSAVSETGDAPIVLTGHQPQLFHPGVWFKNFVLSALGKQFRAPAINLLIDNDTLRSASLRVPTGTVASPHIENTEFDRATDEIPLEERAVLDGELFATFGQRVAETLSPLVADPLVEELWPWAVEARQRGGNLGQCLAEARHRLEGNWNLTSWELPLSQVCDSRPFHWFASHLLTRLPCFRDIYNDSLAEYRRVHRIRSRSHPVPDLAEEDGWLEAPFWLWSEDDAQRRRLFARGSDGQIEISDRHRFQQVLNLSDDSEAGDATDQLQQLRNRGIKLRGRALITTMYARLMLCDLFLHGIGGAKYDQLTDAIVQRFFGFPPPAFLTMSATAQLPIARERPDDGRLLQLRRWLRELDYNPQRHAEDGDDQNQTTIAQLAQEKSEWIAKQLPQGQRGERHRQITRINSQLQPYVSRKRIQWANEYESMSQSLHIEAILASREYSFALFPEKTLRPLLLELSGVAA